MAILQQLVLPIVRRAPLSLVALPLAIEIGALLWLVASLQTVIFPAGRRFGGAPAPLGFSLLLPRVALDLV